MDEIIDYHLDGVDLAYFARVYGDERSSQAAWERGLAKVRPDAGVSAFRVRRPSGEFLVVVVGGSRADARRARERVAWGGELVELTLDEAESVMARFREIMVAGQHQSVARWGGVGGLMITPEGSAGTGRRPQG